jgi:ribosome recycling factor
MSNIAPALQPVFKEAEDKMKKSIDKLSQEFSSVRSGAPRETCWTTLKWIITVR